MKEYIEKWKQEAEEEVVQKDKLDLRGASGLSRSFSLDLTISLGLLVSLGLVKLDEAFSALGIFTL